MLTCTNLDAPGSGARDDQGEQGVGPDQLGSAESGGVGQSGRVDHGVTPVESTPQTLDGRPPRLGLELGLE